MNVTWLKLISTNMPTSSLYWPAQYIFSKWWTKKLYKRNHNNLKLFCFKMCKY
jgi:hypothetical protein